MVVGSWDSAGPVAPTSAAGDWTLSESGLMTVSTSPPKTGERREPFGKPGSTRRFWMPFKAPALLPGPTPVDRKCRTCRQWPPDQRRIVWDNPMDDVTRISTSPSLDCHGPTITQ